MISLQYTDNIDDEYTYANHYNITLLIMKKNNFFNVTRLCECYTKTFYEWIENDNNKIIYKLIQDTITDKCVIIIPNGFKYFRGTYLHLLFLPLILIWLSPEYALMASKRLIRT